VGERNAQNRFGEEKQCSLAPDARASGCVRATHAGACGLGCQARHLGASWPLGQAQAGGGAWLLACSLRARGGAGLAADAGAGPRRRERAGPRRMRGWAGGAASWAERCWRAGPRRAQAHEREGWRGGKLGAGPGAGWPTRERVGAMGRGGRKRGGGGRGWAGRNGPGREAGLKSVFSFSFLFPFSFLFISV
jgi:hypothetical protein